jgi:novobiocin biosynthesis protein NovU/D-mycarose 3-C-methyltransferase
MTAREFRDVTFCRVCGGSEWVEVLSFGPMPLANRYVTPDEPREAEPRFPLDVAFCPGCGLVSLRQVVDPAVLYRHYVYISSESRMIRDHTRWLARLIVERFGLAADSLVVEFGSNIGLQLADFQALDVRVLGVDPARNLAAIANARGVATLPEFFDGDSAKEILRRAGSPRVLLGRHVFAHIDDLSGVFDAAEACLAEDGVIVIEVPYVADMVDGNEFDTIYHEHLSYFSIGTLRRLFARFGFRVFDVERVGVHGGSVVVFACREDARHAPTARLDGIVAAERTRGIQTARYFTDFAARAREIREALRELVAAARREGGVVAGYGAPAKGNTLLNFCGFGTDDVAFVTDTTEFKHGKLLPGTRIPVYPEAYGRARPPDRFVMLAWNYAREILGKERAYLAAGGRFIVPIPFPTVVSDAEVGAFLAR